MAAAKASRRGHPAATRRTQSAANSMAMAGVRPHRSSRSAMCLRGVLNRIRHWLRYRPERRYMGGGARRAKSTSHG
jgi:hypothetical protein